MSKTEKSSDTGAHKKTGSSDCKEQTERSRLFES